MTSAHSPNEYSTCKGLMPMADPHDPATLAKVKGWLVEAQDDLDYYHTHKDSGAEVTFGVGYVKSCRVQIKCYGRWIQAAERIQASLSDLRAEGHAI